VAAARRAGEQRPLALFVAGARGFLRGSWEGRGVGSLFVDKDVPPGFELMRRTRGHEWLRQNSLLLRAPDDAIGRVTVAVLTTVIGEAAREVMASRTRREADAIIDAAVEMIERLGVLAEVTDGRDTGEGSEDAAGPEEADLLRAGENPSRPESGEAATGV
jgi:hypothetical protein